MPFRQNPLGRPSAASLSSGSLFGNGESKPAAEFIVAHIDGGSRGNPGPAGYGVHVQNARGETIAKLCQFLGVRTNNFAEYSGLLGVLQYAAEQGHRSLKVISDSELMVKQIRGEYKVKSPDLKELYDQARQMIRKLDSFSIQHALREQNKIADQLANEAMDQGMRRTAPAPAANAYAAPPVSELNGIVRNGVIELLGGELPEGTPVKIRVKR